MTRAALRSLVRDYAQESSTTPLSDALIHDLLHQGEEVLTDLCGYSVAKFTIAFVTNDFDYDLTSGILAIQSVAWNSTAANKEPVSGPTTLQRMDEEFPTWRWDAADRPERWWILGNVLLVHPKPSATYNATNIEIYSTNVPAAMSGDSSEPTDLPVRFHRTLAKYAAWQWLSIDKENPSALRLAAMFQAQFQYDAQKLRELISGRARTDGMGIRVHTGRPSSLGSVLGNVPDEPD